MSEEYTCKTICIFRGRRWRPGETLVSLPNEVIPPHFTKDKIELPPKDVYKPTTMSAITEQIAMEENERPENKARQLDTRPAWNKTRGKINKKIIDSEKPLRGKK